MTRVRKKVFLSIFIVLFTLIIGYKTGYVYAEAPHDQNFDDVTGYGVGSCQIGDLNFITDDNLSIEVKGSDALSYAASDAINAGGNIAGFSGSGICNDNSFSSNPTKIGFECANGSSTFKLESLYALVSKISDSSTSVDITGYHVSGGSKEVYAHIAGVDFTKPGATQYIDDAGYPVTFSGNVNSDTANDGYGEYGGLLTFGSDWYDINRVEFTRFDPVSGTNKVLYISLDSIDLSNLTDISVGDITVDEDKNAEFTVNLTKPYDKDLTVDYSFADGKAKAGEDYTAIGGTVIIPAKALSAPIMVPINDDSDFEEAEDFYINLSNPSVGGLADSQAQCIITDNDHRPKVKLSLDNSSINENGGKTKIKADLSNKSYQDVTVNLNFSGTAAAAGYTASSTQITIPAGQLSGYVDISAKDNNTYDGENKILTADITGPVNADKDDFQPPSLEIIDNETEPQVSLSLLGDTISEDGSKKAKVTAALSNPSFEDVTVYLDFSDAELGKDFTTDNKIVIPAGQSSNFIEIQGIENSVFNFNKTLKISMASVENGFPSGDPVTATVANDEAAPVVTMEKAEINEKDSDTNKAVFKVSIPEASGEDVTVYYTTSDGSAKEGKDYTGVVMGKLTIPKGQTSEDIKIDVLNDEIDEDDETFTVSLSNPEGATIGTPSQTCTITDDDNAPYITIGGNPVYEGDTGTGTNYMIFDVTLSAESGKKVSVNYSTADDTATQGSDYEAVTGNLTFNPGETSKQVKVKIIGDDTKEQDETFLLKLTASNAADTDYQATGTILNDDDPLLSINDMSVKEGDTGNKITFTVSLSKPSADSVTVDYKTVDGTAVSGKDYVSKDGTITFDKNETQKTITIDVNDDTIYEDDETFYVDLSNSSVAITKARGTGTIQDNDPKPSITIKNISVDEGSSGSTDAEFTIIMSSESSKAVTVNYITEDGSAKAGADYEKAQGVLTFVPGETEKKITVKIAADTVDEDDESFDLILSDAAGADLGASTATCTITDDDAAPGISIGDCTVKEGDSGYAELVFDVTLSEASGKQVSVDYSTSDGTAVQGTDYVAASGKLTFNPGETSKQIKVNVIGDINLETDKNLTVNLTNLVNTQALDVTGEGTIKDDDLPVIKITGKDTNGDAKEIVNGDTTPSLEDNTDFGTVVTGDAKTITREFTITNTGNSELTLTGDKPYVTIDGDNKADFTVVTGPAISIKGGASTTFSITFKPSKAQQETATVTITSNDATNSPFVFTIIGEGTVPPPSGGGSTTPSTPSNPPTKQERLNISFGDNSSKEVIADVLDENNVRTTKIDLDEAQVPKKLDEMEKTQPDGEKKVIIPVNNHSDKVVGEMKASTLKKMADMNAVLEIKTENISYTLPASAVNIDDILTKIGGSTELKDITVKVEIVNTADSKAGQIKAAAAKSGFELEAAPVEFEITCTNSGREVTVSSFNSYVGRTVAIPDGVDPKKITTGVVYNADGSFSHVPTAVTILNGKYYAKINSLTNSTYTLIYNPLTFDDVENHWSKGYVNDAGSRLIVSGTGNGKFTPDRAVTRGEFAVMIVKALGLKGSQFADNFKDVGKDNPYYSYIYTAYQYGIIAGYSNTRFGSNDMITREQAMTMISKAMKIAGIDTAQSNTDGLNSTFTDSDTISGWAKEGAAICANSGLFVGSNGKLNPKNDITRAESATVAIKLLKKAHLI